MNITGISGSGMISGGGGADEEYKRIIAKLLELGIKPSGSKSADKAKLRQIEMQKLKTELGPTGSGTTNPSKYVTISASEIHQLKEKLKSKKQDENTPEMQEKRNAAQNRTGAEQLSLLNQYFLKKKNVT